MFNILIQLSNGAFISIKTFYSHSLIKSTFFGNLDFKSSIYWIQPNFKGVNLTTSKQLHRFQNKFKNFNLFN